MTISKAILRERPIVASFGLASFLLRVPYPFFERRLMMKYRILSLGLAVAALMVFLSAAVEGQDKDKNVHVGKLVSVKGNLFTMENIKGEKHDHTLAQKAKVFDLDGKECRLSDLKRDQIIRVTTSPTDTKVAMKVEAMKKRE
jgi:hypothetical protein